MFSYKDVEAKKECKLFLFKDKGWGITASLCLGRYITSEEAAN